MTYRLGQRIVIMLGDEAFELRPSLRHALALARREGSFQKLAREIDEGSVSAALDIIRPQVESEPSRLLDIWPSRVLAALPFIQPQLKAFVIACTGDDPDEKPSSKPGKTIPYPEYLTDLYRIATGWLGWTPDEALNATPIEIVEAHRGRLDMLKAIFGTSEKTGKSETTHAFTDQNVKALFSAFGTTRVQRKAA
jgi:hypothetical protein